MSDTQDWKTRLFDVPKQLLSNRFVIALLALLILGESFNSMLLAPLLEREGSIAAKAESDNAELRLKEQAAIQEQGAIKAKAQADNAAIKQEADTRTAQSNADIAKSHAEIAAAQASNSSAQAEGDADNKTAVARLTEQDAIVQKEIARYASRKFRAEAESQQIGVALTRLARQFYQNHLTTCMDCDPTYCILCGFSGRRQVADLPSGAELPDAEAGETPLANPPKPKLTVFVSQFSFQRNSPCDHGYQTWKASLAYGAYATGYPGCDYAASRKDIETARRDAIKNCYSHYGARNCHVVAEITVEEPPGPPKPRPTGTPVLTRVYEPKFPLGGGCRTSFDKWSTSGLYGAFAVSKSHCGFAKERDDLETAKNDAMRFCGSDCTLVYIIATDPAADKASAVANAKSVFSVIGGDDKPGAASKRGTVIPPQLNVHSEPKVGADNIVGKLNRGQTFTIIGLGVADFIAIEAVCADGKPCKGYVNGRKEFVAR